MHQARSSRWRSLDVWTDRSGGIAAILGLMLPLLCGVVGIAVDYSTWVGQSARLQQASDAAALAATRELGIGTPDEKRLQAVAQSIVASIIKPGEGDSPVTVKITPVRRPEGKPTEGGSQTPQPMTGVKVTLTQRKAAIMSTLVTPELTDMEVSSTAVASGGTRVCVIGLDEAAADTIRLDNNAKISAPDCSVYANAVHTAAVRSENQARVTSLLTCSAGGYRQTSSTNFYPKPPLTDCPKRPDPLLDRPTPSVGPCLLNKTLYIKNKTVTLYPGTYCGGLYIEKGARVTLSPGIYVMKNGPFIVGPGRPDDEENPLRLPLGRVGGDDDDDDDEDEDDDGNQGDEHAYDDDGTPASTGWVKGTGVGIYFTGDIKKSQKTNKHIAMRFEPNSVVELTAPTAGSMAGLLFYEDRRAPLDRRYEILSDGARKLVGTIYLSRGIFHVSANQSVADQSEYTAVVARRIELLKAPNLVLNTRYGDTPVPVPEGLGPNSGKLRLTE